MNVGIAGVCLAGDLKLNQPKFLGIYVLFQRRMRMEKQESRTIVIQIGNLDPENKLFPLHVQVGRLTPMQGRALKRLRVGLSDSPARLQNGSHIDTNADVIRYLLESVGE